MKVSANFNIFYKSAEVFGVESKKCIEISTALFRVYRKLITTIRFFTAKKRKNMLTQLTVVSLCDKIKAIKYLGGTMKMQSVKSTRLAIIVCLFTVLTLLFTSCDVLKNVIPGLSQSSGNDIVVKCSDANNDHLCDDCGEPLGACYDSNGDKDHACDICKKQITNCADGNDDHKCDECMKVISVCYEGRDHKCRLCGILMNACSDNDSDHKCDVCSNVLSGCDDGQKADHYCDICGALLSDCTDKDDHTCDICGKTVSLCFDENNDHKCDLCGKTFSECCDDSRDHFCDICKVRLTNCEDKDGNHICDLCDRTISICLDDNNDHICDICLLPVSLCGDNNRDHLCDICLNVISLCEDNSRDHLCDICSTPLSECEDKTPKDHLCDVCSRPLSECEDKAPKDHLCDICSLPFSECEDKSPVDHNCDVCGAVLSECVYVDRVCEVCGGTTIYKHVVILGVDGAGSFFKDTDTPNMDAIFAGGAITYTGTTESPSLSTESWASLIHGVNASVHGITANSQGSYPLNSDYPSFFRVIRENDASLELGSYTTWDTINKLIVEDGLGITKVGWSGTDADLTARICQYVMTSAPTALYVQFDNVDAAGHKYGFGSAEHLAKISETDALIGLVYEAYVEKGIIGDTLFIVTTDHGGTQVPSGSYLGNHGGETPEEKEITFAAAGKTVVNGGTVEDFEIRDTAAIVLYALGYEQPESWTARVPSGLFEGVIAGERPVWDKPQESEKELSDYVSKELLAHLTFDKTIADTAENYSTAANGSATYREGYLDEALSINSNSVTIDNFDIGTNTLTFSTWVKVDSLIGDDPVVFANKNWRSGMNAGILVCVHSYGYIHVNISNGNVRTDLKVNYDKNALNEWMNIIVVVDRTENRVGLSINFGEITFMDLNSGLQESSLNTEYDLVIGQDGTTAYTSYLKALVDDFMIFNGAFDQNDVSALKEYYNKKQI